MIWKYPLFNIIAGMVLLVISSGFFSGCTSVVNPHISTTDFLIVNEKIPAKIQLYITEHFKNHRVTKTDVSGLTKLQFELGLLAVEAFRLGLESQFTNVDIKSGTPRFPVQKDKRNEFFAIVYPVFTSSKFENYTVDVIFDVNVYSHDGTLLLSKNYKGHGVKKGPIGASTGFSAYPSAAQAAVKNAVEQVVSDIARLARSHKPTRSAVNIKEISNDTEKLKMLETMRSLGILSQEEFETLKKGINSK